MWKRCSTQAKTKHSTKLEKSASTAHITDPSSDAECRLASSSTPTVCLTAASWPLSAAAVAVAVAIVASASPTAHAAKRAMPPPRGGPITPPPPPPIGDKQTAAPALWGWVVPTTCARRYLLFQHHVQGRRPCSIYRQAAASSHSFSMQRALVEVVSLQAPRRRRRRPSSVDHRGRCCQRGPSAAAPAGGAAAAARGWAVVFSLLSSGHVTALWSRQERPSFRLLLCSSSSLSAAAFSCSCYMRDYKRPGSMQSFNDGRPRRRVA